MSALPVVFLRPGREKSLLRRHPWVFSGAVDRIEGATVPGETVLVCDSRGRKLALGAWSPESQLTVRVWSFDAETSIDAEFFRGRIDAAAKLRETLGLGELAGGCRLIFSEGDDLPGLIVDRYASVLAAQFLSAGVEYHREAITAALAALPGVTGIFERSEVSVRRKEGLEPRRGVLWGEVPEHEVEIVEDDMRFAVDIRHGQKTGFYFDLRDARRAVRSLAAGRRVLNCFAYTGGFAVASLLGGAQSVLDLDSSAPALAQGQRTLALNGIPADRGRNLCCDVFTELRKLTAEKCRFDLVILDPPKLIESRSHLSAGCRAYQDLARLGFGLLEKGGVLCNFSCSGLMTPELFQKITASAAFEAGKDARIVGRLFQAADHPVSLAAPESAYLKGLVSAIC